MRILGISAFHRDAAAALLVDGQPVAAAREEHFSGRARDARFPTQAIRFCLAHAGIRAADLDRVVFYEKPLRKFERVLVSQLRAFPRSARSFAHGAFAWLGDRLWVKNQIVKDLDVEFDQVLFTEHQLALAANAFYQSPYPEAAVMTLDDAGEWATASLGVGNTAGLEIRREMRFPHSLGFVVSAITQFLGFRPGHEEHAIEALAPLGKDRFVDVFRSLIPAADGYFTVDTAAFRFAFDSERLYGEPLVEHLGPPRFSGEPLRLEAADSHHADIAHSLQMVLEERALALSQRAYEVAGGIDRLCFGGELAANRQLVAALRRESPFAEVFVPDPATKSGGALGAALLVQHALVKDTERTPIDLRLGEGVDDRAEPGAAPLADSAVATLADRLGRGHRCAWVRGRVEFREHSHANRIVLSAPARDPDPGALLACLQRGESFLPCRRAAVAGDPSDAAWPQPVAAATDPELHDLLSRVGELWITDFALRGQPVVRTEADAVAAFERSQLDCLVVADRLYERP